MGSSLLSVLAGRFLPRQCLLCEAPCGSEPLCPPCRSFLPGASRARCRICARPWQTSDCCASCRASPPSFDATLAVADYVAPLDRAITALKFSASTGLATGLGALLADAWIAAADPQPGTANSAGGTSATRPTPAQPLDFVVPVPLSAERLAERGFNQAQLIGRAMLRRLPERQPRPILRPEMLRRQHDTLAQSLLPWAARQANLDHGFVAPFRLNGLSIGVIDDVMTTGATLQAAGLALKLAGAARVVNLIVARTA
jgi:ComF family protein